VCVTGALDVSKTLPLVHSHTTSFTDIPLNLRLA